MTQSGLGISLKNGKTEFYFITFALFYYSWMFIVKSKTATLSQGKSSQIIYSYLNNWCEFFVAFTLENMFLI